METSTTNVRPASCRVLKSSLTSFPKFCQLSDVLRNRVWELAGFRPLSGRILKNPPTTFFRFLYLPAEIRLNIWRFAMDTEPAYSREFKVNGWSEHYEDIPYVKSAENWVKPWSEAIHPAFTANEWEETTPNGPIFEAMNLRGSSRLPRHVQQVLGSCREARDEFRQRYIRFSGSTKRADLLIFGETWRINELSGKTTAQRRAKIVARSGTTYYQVDSEHSSPSYFDARHDRLFIPTFGICDMLDRWLPKQLSENLRFLSINEFDLMLCGDWAEQMLLKFSNLEELVVFDNILPSLLGDSFPLPSHSRYRDAKAYLQNLAHENPGWKKPRLTCRAPRILDVFEGSLIASQL
ncbi:hypothetical protein DL98DRAFT_514621 [Cadophora sp. DSE1049]|nr:hypothetical protein DL98DRAFT_514621 [Cadophora sp. DSE1049]